MSIIIQQLNYIHSDRESLFCDLNLTVNEGEKIALTGANGSGKSTLLRILAGKLKPLGGSIYCTSDPYYVPQHFGQYNQYTVAEALQAGEKIKALYAILDGDIRVENFTVLADDWSIEERCLAALSAWGLGHLSLSQSISNLSGGEKTKVFLAGIAVHSPAIILFDEPTNHLDTQSRQQLYHLVTRSHSTLIIVSHDRTLLDKLSCTYELEGSTLTRYGGNYTFYQSQKEQQLTATQAMLGEKTKELRLARKIAQEVAERKQKNDARGKKRNEKKGLSRMAMNTQEDRAEKSTTRLSDIHATRQETVTEQIADLRKSLPDLSRMKMNFHSSDLHAGKILVTARNVNFSYTTATTPLWVQPLSFEIHSGERLAIRGHNGSGKTTLLKLITGALQPTEGEVIRTEMQSVYIDQEYSIIQDNLTVYEQAEQFNSYCFAECELKIILCRFLFDRDSWNKPCKKLSGGEKMRLVFCCLLIRQQTPDLFILDEPTNNLDLPSIAIITSAIRQYHGTVLVVSHDERFVREIGISAYLQFSLISLSTIGSPSSFALVKEAHASDFLF